MIYAESSLNMNAGLRRQKIGAGEKARLIGQDYKQMEEQLEKLLVRFMPWEM
jgi:hypothetical protein